MEKMRHQKGADYLPLREHFPLKESPCRTKFYLGSAPIPPGRGGGENKFPSFTDGRTNPGARTLSKVILLTGTKGGP